MIVRVIKVAPDFDGTKESFSALHKVSNSSYEGSEVQKVDAETVIMEIASGKAIAYKATTQAIHNNHFEAEDTTQIDAFLKRRFTVYVLNSTNYRKVKNLYERTFA